MARALIKSNFDDNYEINNFIGRGGFSYVYQGISRSTKSKVAIKKIDKLKLMQIKNGAVFFFFLSLNLNFLKKELVHSEILIMKKLEHPNIVKLFDVYQSDQYFYLVMEYLDGFTL